MYELWPPNREPGLLDDRKSRGTRPNQGGRYVAAPPRVAHGTAVDDRCEGPCRPATRAPTQRGTVANLVMVLLCRGPGTAHGMMEGSASGGEGQTLGFPKVPTLAPPRVARKQSPLQCCEAGIPGSEPNVSSRLSGNARLFHQDDRVTRRVTGRSCAVCRLEWQTPAGTAQSRQKEKRKKRKRKE